MGDDRTHPLLVQVPLTVSPFVTLPLAATLPYTYKTMPSTLPPPSTGVTGPADEKPKYVLSPSGHAAHPEDIMDSCHFLREHHKQLQLEADRMVQHLMDSLRDRELAEKRRLAPGWLDSEARLLEPVRNPGAGSGAVAADHDELTGRLAEMSIEGREMVSEMAVDQGEELDRAFGGWK